MAGSLNKVMLIGRLGADPEARQTTNGNTVVTFNLATDESYKDREGRKIERTEWHRIVVWDRLAEICKQYLHKGSLIYIEGRLQTRSWEDRDTGKKNYITEIVATDMTMLDSRSERSAPSLPAVNAPAASAPEMASAKTYDLPPKSVIDAPPSEPASDDLPF